MNKYNVIHLDISSFWDFYKDNIVEKIIEYICEEIREVYKDKLDYSKMIHTILMSVYRISNIPFVIIMDEWDCVINMYNPNSVSIAMDRHRFDSYWENTSSFASINTFITMNYGDIKEDIMTMLAGGMVMVETDAFQNDLSEIHSKDDALTALIHLGYLAYDEDRKSAYIPNYEVAKVFQMVFMTDKKFT